MGKCHVLVNLSETLIKLRDYPSVVFSNTKTRLKSKSQRVYGRAKYLQKKIVGILRARALHIKRR